MAKEKYTAEQMIAALKETKGLVYLAARKLQCSPTTVFRYLDCYPTVQQARMDERGQIIDVGEAALFSAVAKGEEWAVKYILSRLGKDRGYTERTEHRHGGDESAPPIRTETDAGGEEVRALLATLRAALGEGAGAAGLPGSTAGADPGGLDAAGDAGNRPPDVS